MYKHERFAFLLSSWKIALSALPVWRSSKINTDLMGAWKRSAMCFSSLACPRSLRERLAPRQSKMAQSSPRQFAWFVTCEMSCVMLNSEIAECMPYSIIVLWCSELCVFTVTVPTIIYPFVSDNPSLEYVSGGVLCVSQFLSQLHSLVTQAWNKKDTFSEHYFLSGIIINRIEKPFWSERAFACLTWER